MTAADFAFLSGLLSSFWALSFALLVAFLTTRLRVFFGSSAITKILNLRP
jgi:hypothetical protein